MKYSFAVKPDEIPFYDLYGESFLKLSADFVHLEDIRARSAGLGWEISPHRHGKLFQLICVFDDEWTVQRDDEKLTLQGDWVVTLPPGVVHGFTFAPDTNGYVLSVNADVVNALRSDSAIADFTGAVWSSQAIEFQDKHQSERFVAYLHMLAGEMRSNDPGATVSIHMLLKLLFVLVARQQNTARNLAGTSGRDSRVLLGFRELIDKYYQQHMNVNDYASKLYISVSTLSRICQQHLNTTPKKLIHQRLVNEAKRRLIYTRQSLDEIADTLGFKDTGYFCRFFKQAEGTTAGEFRRRSEL
ncbi:MAG: hypothetical protein CL587_14905 [Alteromonadaceae bacterium]|nr:hypothetical protein [Alteromonadaceae bacterium]